MSAFNSKRYSSFCLIYCTFLLPFSCIMVSIICHTRILGTICEYNSAHAARIYEDMCGHSYTRVLWKFSMIWSVWVWQKSHTSSLVLCAICIHDEGLWLSDLYFPPHRFVRPTTVTSFIFLVVHRKSGESNQKIDKRTQISSEGTVNGENNNAKAA